MNIQKIYEDLISDISYTNKDFRTIYPELLNLVKKLTNKWDPSVSNESDPGVVLIKLLALIADKNNYNIDKNVLENFPLSVTQLGNAQQLYDSLGYRMSWYRSATLDIGFRLSSTSSGPVELPILTTQVSDSTGSIVYTLLEKVNLSVLNEEKYALCIEGVPHLYNINGSTLITMNNLDSNLRLYFDDTRISENGIFIWDSSTVANMSISETWKRVDNLASQSAKSKVFSFGVLPNSNKCYIQFPDDVATLIGSGLTIWYIIGNGQDGNIKANTIDSWNNDNSSTSEVTSINNNIQIIQTSPSTNGRNPETIDSAYKNYKRNIGTFNTLVTRRDYENFIYNQTDLIGNPIISNVIVSDRTSDINNSYTISTWEPGIERQINKVKTHKVVREIDGSEDTITLDEPNLTPYDIVLYLLKKSDSIVSKTTYDNTFKPEKETLMLMDIEARLEDSKSVNHNVYLPSLKADVEYVPALGDKFTYNNLLTLKGTLITYNKVTKVEASEIESNVINALYNNYNGREVIIGSEIDYDNLIKTIENSDERIKYLVLNDNYYNTYLTRYSTGDQTELTDDDKNEIIAKMVLAGKTQLFKFQDDFLYDFGQTDITQIGTVGNAIKSATTWAKITIPDNTSEYTIKENELVQVYHDNLITSKEYGFYVKYKCNLLTSISANENRILQPTEYIDLEYSSGGTIVTETINPGQIIQPSFALDTNSQGSIQSGQSIKIKTKNEFVLVDGMPYYFILNNAENRLNLNSSNNFTYILQENEYFLYSSPSSTDLVVLGSGTKLSSDLEFNVVCELVDIDSLTNNNTVSWNKIPSGINNPKLKTTELYIQTFNEGVKIKFNDSTSKTLSSNEASANIAVALTNAEASQFRYLDVGADTYSSLEVLPNGTSWFIQSRLNLYASNIVPQTLTDTQHIKFILEDSTSTEVTNRSILFNNNVVLAGGTNIDMKVLNDLSEFEYSLLANTYVRDTDFDLTRNTSGYYSLNGSNPEYILPFDFSSVSSFEESWLIPIYVNKANAKINIYTSEDGVNYDIPLNLFKGAVGGSENLSSGSFILQVPLNNNYIGLKVEFNGIDTQNDNITIDYITKLNGYNTEEIDDDDYSLTENIEDVLDKITTLDTDNQFNWVLRVSDLNKVLKPVSPEAFWDINHICNRFTLPQIDFATTSIRVNKSNIS